MLELERLGVRVVSGRLGRGKDDEEGDDASDEGEKKSTADNKIAGGNNNMMGGNNNNMGGVSILKSFQCHWYTGTCAVTDLTHIPFLFRYDDFRWAIIWEWAMRW